MSDTPESKPLPMDELEALAPSRGFTLLEGVRVLDLTSSIAGPYCTMLLADLGADVVKVERSGVGDDSRMWGPPFLGDLALWFASVNRNKRSVTLDFVDATALQTLREMVAACDVVVSTLRQSSMRRLGVDYEQAKRLRPDVIHCTVTGFGLTGPNSELAGYDLIAEGVSGVMDLTGEADQGPQKVGTPAADLLAGMDAAYAIVAALYDRARTGSGHQVDVSLAESMTRFLTPKLVAYLGSGDPQRRSGGRDSVIAVYQVFETMDDPMTIALGNDAIFKRFCAAIGRNDLADDPTLATNQDRRARRAELVEEIQAVMRTDTRAHWLALCAEVDVPAGPINSVDDVVADDHLRSRRLFYRTSDPVTPQVNTGWHLDGAANGYRFAPPACGADTAQVLADWGLTAPTKESRPAADPVPLDGTQFPH